MLVVNVKGGTGAGRKRPLKTRRTDAWTCACPTTHPAHVTRCPRCRKDRS